MISIQAKKHDNFSVEFKFGFNCHADGNTDDFAVNAWIFVPNSLDINPEIYGKKQFYRDIKSNVRLITPVFSLEEMARETSLPLNLLREAVNKVAKSQNTHAVDAYEYHLKMFAAIFKSALREQASCLMKSCCLPDASDLVDIYVVNASKVLKEFRSLYELIDRPEISPKIKGSFKMCDEFMTHVLEVRTVRLVKLMDKYSSPEKYSRMRNALSEMLACEHAYRKRMGYAMLDGNPERDRRLVHHFGMLKKFIESELYIRLDKKKDGMAIQQIYYSLAAGVAMIFATGVAWHTQVKYGNITWPLFVALVVSYMLKDRIKDLLRYYFAHKLGNKYYDKKADITIGNAKVGAMKEGFDFISSSKMPSEVKAMRDESSFVEDESEIFDEKIMLYRQRVNLDDKAMALNGQYSRQGVNEILRLHLNRFTHKMDNPEVVVDKLDDDGMISSLKVQKIYYVNIIFKLVHDGDSHYKHFRIAMTRNGVVEIEQIKKI